MTYLTKLQLEQNTTEPAQSSCSSDTISKSNGAPAKQLYKLLHNGKVIFHGYKDTKTANIVHGHAVSNSELKFAIVKVVSSRTDIVKAHLYHGQKRIFDCTK